MSKITELVQKEVAPIIKRRNDQLVDVEYVKEKGKNYLRIYVDQDKPGGIDINEIAALSELVSQKLDELRPNPFAQPYVLELSSPGAERPIKTAQDWQRALNNYVHVSLYQKIEGAKIFEGTLKSYDEKQIELTIKIKTRRKTIAIPRKLIAKMRFAIEF